MSDQRPASSGTRTYPPIKPTDLPVDIVLCRLDRVTGSGPTWNARCPAHPDHKPSLALRETPGCQLLIHCHAGCAVEEVLDAIDLDLSFLFPSPYALAFGSQRRSTRVIPPPADVFDLEDEPEIDFLKFGMLALNARNSTDPQQLGDWSRRLGVPATALRTIGCGVRDDRLVTPECSKSDLLVVGLAYRDIQGRKTCEPGSHRGLILTRHKPSGNGALFIAEGATDTAALIGVRAIGRPAAHASRHVRFWLTQYLALSTRRDTIVVADRDDRHNGRAAGQDGARELALHLSQALGRNVRWALPRRGYKDVREQIVARDWGRGLVIREARP